MSHANDDDGVAALAGQTPEQQKLIHDHNNETAGLRLQIENLEDILRQHHKYQLELEGAGYGAYSQTKLHHDTVELIGTDGDLTA